MKKALGTFVMLSPLIALLAIKVALDGTEVLIFCTIGILGVVVVSVTTFIGMKLRGDI